MSAAAGGSTGSTRSGIGLFFDGSMPTVAGWVLIFVGVLLALAPLTWFLCWRRGRIGFCCGRTRAQRTRAQVRAAGGPVQHAVCGVVTGACHALSPCVPGWLLLLLSRFWHCDMQAHGASCQADDPKTE